MRILILGSTGFVGHNAAEWFAAKGHEVAWHGFMRQPVRTDGGWIEADLRQPKAVDYSGFDVVIQCAAATSGCKDTLEDPAMHIANNAVMNSYILKECAAAKVKHVIFPSCSVMYQSSPHPLKECDFDANMPLNPAYLGFASTKLYTEKLCQFYSGLGETRFTVFRNSNFYGNYDKFDLEKGHFFGATVKKVMDATGDRISLWGTGQEARDLLHISDFCNLVDLAIEKQQSKFELFNCGSGNAIKIYDYAEKIIAASGKNLSIICDTSKPTIPTSLSLDCTKAKETLGWVPKISLDDGIELTLDWYRNNFYTQEDAALAYNKAALKYHEEFAKINVVLEE